INELQIRIAGLRVDGDGLLQLFDAFGEHAPADPVGAAQRRVRAGVVRLNLHSPLDAGDGFVVAAHAQVSAAQELMRKRQARVDGDGFLFALNGFEREFRQAQETPFQIVNRSQPRPRVRIVRVYLYRLLEKINPPVEGVAARRAQVHHAARELFVSLDRLRFVVLDSVDLRGIEAQVQALAQLVNDLVLQIDRKSTRLNSSHSQISYAVFCLKKKNNRLLYFNP